MNLNPYFKSVLDQDRASIVLCGLDHTILYMNPAAIRSYAKHGGAALVGRSLANCHNAHSNEMIQTVVDWFAKVGEMGADLVRAARDEPDLAEGKRPGGAQHIHIRDDLLPALVL